MAVFVLRRYSPRLLLEDLCTGPIWAENFSLKSGRKSSMKNVCQNCCFPRKSLSKHFWTKLFWQANDALSCRTKQTVKRNVRRRQLLETFFKRNFLKSWNLSEMITWVKQAISWWKTPIKRISDYKVWICFLRCFQEVLVFEQVKLKNFLPTNVEIFNLRKLTETIENANVRAYLDTIRWIGINSQAPCLLAAGPIKQDPTSETA